MHSPRFPARCVCRAGILAPALILLVTLSTDSRADGPYPWRDLAVTSQGLGDVRIGMTLVDASAHFVTSFLDATYFYGDNGCASYAFGKGMSDQDWEVRFLAENKVVQRVDVYTPLIAHPAGFNVGDRVENLLAGRAQRYEVTRGQDEAVRYIQTQEDGFVSSYTVRVDPEVLVDSTAPLRGVIQGWSIGNLDAGSVEGCL